MGAAVDMRSPGSWNISAYASGDPTNLNDPEGLDACSEVKLAGWEGIPAGTTVGDFLSQNSDLSYFAVTVFTESGPGWDLLAALEKAAIAAVIMNRWQVVNGYVDVYTGVVGRANSYRVRSVPDWGRPDGTIGSIVFAPNQFAVWSSPGQLASSAQGNLNRAKNAKADSDECISLLQAIATAAGFWAERNAHAMYRNAEGLFYTSFGSGAGAANKSYYETTMGSYGSANVFYGVWGWQLWPHGVPVPEVVPRPRAPIVPIPRPPGAAPARE
jgi:hypothetical protein